MTKKTTDEYELTYLEREAPKPFEIEGLLEQFKVKVSRINRLGEKFLSYPIKKTNKAQLVSLVFEAQPQQIAQVNHALRFEDSILRHLIVKDIIRPAERVKPALLAAEKVIESRELEEKQEEEKKTKGKTKEKVLPGQDSSQVRLEKLEEKLGKLLEE